MIADKLLTIIRKNLSPLRTSSCEKVMVLPVPGTASPTFTQLMGVTPTSSVDCNWYEPPAWLERLRTNSLSDVETVPSISGPTGG
jgi:hypothetical protein